MNQPSYFEIQSSNPEASIAFYTQVFDWKFHKQEGLPIPYWQIETEGMHGGLLQRPAAVPGSEQGTNAYCISMEVADFDTTAAKIIAAGGIEALPKFAIAGKCWQGYFIDTAQNTFGIFQVDESVA